MNVCFIVIWFMHLQKFLTASVPRPISWKAIDVHMLMSKELWPWLSFISSFEVWKKCSKGQSLQFIAILWMNPIPCSLQFTKGILLPLHSGQQAHIWKTSFRMLKIIIILMSSSVVSVNTFSNLIFFELEELILSDRIWFSLLIVAVKRLPWNFCLLFRHRFFLFPMAAYNNLDSY